MNETDRELSPSHYADGTAPAMSARRRDGTGEMPHAEEMPLPAPTSQPNKPPTPRS